MQKAFIYCRVSTEEQANEGHSLDTQEKFCKKFADANDYQVIEVFRDEGKSGTSLNRPALQELLATCQQDKTISTVLVQETDRLARNTKDHLTIRALLQKAGVKLISVAQPMLDDSPEGKMIDTIIASVNQFQSDINSRKTRKGLQDRFESGWLPGWAPIGYKNALLNDHKVITPDPEKWDLVKKAFQMYLTGSYSAIEIADALSEKGLKSKTGKKICNCVMTDTIRNPFYAGIIKWHGQEKVGNHKPMITIAEHQRILTIMEAHNQHSCRRRRHNFLLRGFVFCDICGRRYTAEKHRVGKQFDYYHCSASSRKHSNQGQNIEAKELERQVEERFEGIQFSQSFIDLVAQKIRKFHEEGKIEKEREKRILLNQKMGIERKREIAEEKLISGVLTNDDFVRIRDRFKQDLIVIQNEIDDIEAKREIDTETVRQVLMFSRDVYRSYKTVPDEIQRLYLGFFWDSFLVRDGKIVNAKPTKLIEALIQEKHIILSSDLCPSPKLIRTLQDWGYMMTVREKLHEIKERLRGSMKEMTTCAQAL